MKPLGFSQWKILFLLSIIFAIHSQSQHFRWFEINILVIFFSQEWITKLGVTSWRKIILHLIKWMHFILGYTGIFGKCVVFHSNFDWNKNSIPPKKATRTSCGVNAIPCVQFRKFEWNTYEKKAHIQIRAKKQT